MSSTGSQWTYATQNEVTMADVRHGLSPKDYHLINPTPDKDFSPEHNRHIVNETIKETEKYFQSFNTRNDTDLGNRIDILSSYGIYRFNRGTKTIDEYLGKKLMNAVIGERLLEKLRIAEATNTIVKNSRIQKGILL